MDATQLLRIVQQSVPSQYLQGDVQAGEVRNNLSLSNGEYFIKVAGRGARPGGIVAELDTAMYLTATGYDTITMPALDHAFSTPLGDASVWHFFPGSTPKHGEITPQAFISSLRQLVALHDLRLVREGAPNLERLKTGPERRRTLTEWKQMPASLNRDIEKLLNAFVSPLDDRDWGSREVLCHGDAHIGNILVNEKALVWCDWESAVMAPREYDIAALRHNILRIGGRKDLWDLALPLIEGYDPDLLDELEMVKAVLGVTYVITHGAYEIARERISALLPVLDGAPLPDRLAFFQ